MVGPAWQRCLGLVAVCAVVSGAEAAPPVDTAAVKWDTVHRTANTAASVLVAADPEWLEGGVMYQAAIAGVAGLAEAGAENIRLLNFNIFPALSCGQLTPGNWNWTLPDQVMKSFMDAVKGQSVLIDIDTSPHWMWADGQYNDTHTCALAHDFELAVGERTRCPNYGNPQVPRDKSWKEIATYFKQVADHYTAGGFVDDDGVAHTDGHHYDWSNSYWEILNEPNLLREHMLSPQAIVDYYDANVAAFGGSAPGGAKFLGPSLCCISHNTTGLDDYLRPFLDPQNHHPSDTPLAGASFHIYAACANNTPPGMEQVFTATDREIVSLIEADKIRREVRPDAELHLTESGIVCNQPHGVCGENDYECWYRSFVPLYWVASAGQWLYQFLTYSAAIDLATISQSQILGYPWQYDGLSGEWASGSMVDFTGTPGLNAKYYVEELLLQNVKRPFSYVDTTVPNPERVYAQGLTSAKGRVVVLINKKCTPSTAVIDGVAGKTAYWIEAANWRSPPTKKVVPTGPIDLTPFAVVLIQVS